MQISIRHQLSVAMGEGVPRAVMHLLLSPQSSDMQTVGEWRLEGPGIEAASSFIDAYGNCAHLVTQTHPEAASTLGATGTIVTHDRNGVLGRLAHDPVPALFTRMTPLTKPIGAVTARFRSAPRHGQERIALLHGLMDRVAEVLRATAGPSQTQSQDGGAQSQSQSLGETKPPLVADDYAHAFIGGARALEVPARYVSGYLLAEDTGVSGLHGWAEAWDDGLGWIAFDAMLGLCPTERHVRLACGLDADSVPPLRTVPASEPAVAHAVAVSA